MKKRPIAPKLKEKDVCKVKEQVSAQIYRTTPRDKRKFARDLYTCPAPRRPGRKISYISDGKIREEPADTPRLFIRGFGGSIKMDLLGVGVDLSEASFAYRVPDENLKDFHIHHGDIAVVDPMRSTFKTGHLILFGLDGREVLGRLEWRHRIWWVQTMDAALPERIAITNQPLYGAVVGIMRLFTPLIPVAYQGTEANFKMLPELSGAADQRHERTRGTTVKPVRLDTLYTKKKRKPFLLVSEPKSPFRLSEKDEDRPHSP